MKHGFGKENTIPYLFTRLKSKGCLYIPCYNNDLIVCTMDKRQLGDNEQFKVVEMSDRK